ncbi:MULTISPECIES: ABC transporter permease [Deinococcus]|uniref:ABC transporter permease n=2 Tax=Deinococcus TaxID=1298 RepID=A0A221SY75_9DEIO|nr:MULTISPECIES: ABC transporter permease [Deinococcus]ASN81571.1 ABC transporter permease [Deinococcus ficus]MDP9765041.1 ABC-type transport system involved in multi-copper enzyme maturation permease subunit [Deinococcus enclensis]
MRNVLLVTELSLREAVRKRLVAVLLVLSALFIGFYLYGIFRMDASLDARAAEAGLNGRSANGSGNLPVMYAAMLGMYLVYFLASLMSVLSTVGAISGDIENGVMQSVIARPIRRSELVLGRWLGFLTVNVTYVALLSATLLGGVYAITGYLPPAPGAAVLLIALAVALLTALTVLGSTLFTTLAGGIGVFVLYGLGSAGGILSAIGQISANPTLTTLGRAANIAMPTNALWLGASYHLQPDLLLEIARRSQGANPFFGSDPMNPGLLAWAAVLTLVAVGGAAWRLSRRDL